MVCGIKFFYLDDFEGDFSFCLNEIHVNIAVRVSCALQLADIQAD